MITVIILIVFICPAPVFINFSACYSILYLRFSLCVRFPFGKICGCELNFIHTKMSSARTHFCGPSWAPVVEWFLVIQKIPHSLLAPVHGESVGSLMFRGPLSLQMLFRLSVLVFGVWLFQCSKSSCTFICASIIWIYNSH